jgi:hypothetical protein
MFSVHRKCFQSLAKPHPTTITEQFAQDGEERSGKGEELIIQKI